MSQLTIAPSDARADGASPIAETPPRDDGSLGRRRESVARRLRIAIQGDAEAELNRRRQESGQ